MKVTEKDDFRNRIFECSPIPIIIMDAITHKFEECNPAAVQIYGFSTKNEVLGKTPVDVSAAVQYDGTPSPSKARFYKEKAIREGSVVFEWKHQRQNGELWDAEVHLLSFSTNNRDFLQFSLIDITERKLIERQQKTLHDMLLELNSCHDMITGLGKVLKAALELGGPDCGGMYAANPADNTLSLVAHSGLSDEFVASVSHYANSAPCAMLAMTGRIQYGTYTEILAPSDPVRKNEGLRAFALIPVMSQGKLIALLNLASHVSDSIPTSIRNALESLAFQAGGILLRLRSEETVRSSEEKFRAAFMTGLDAAYIATEEGRLVETNDAFKNMFGYTREESDGRTVLELNIYVNPLDRAEMMSRLKQFGIVKDMILKGRRKSGETFWGSLSVSHIRLYDKMQLFGVIRDITESRQTEEAYRVLVNTSLQALIIIQKGRIVFANPAAARMSQYSSQELLDMQDPVQSLIHPEDRPALYERLARLSKGETVEPFATYRVVQKNGLVRWAETLTAQTEFRGEAAQHTVYVDITERKRMEEELLKTQKLESLGILAGGIAHDFNNLLSGIYGYIELAGDTVKNGALSAYLSNAMATIDRARGLTLQLLTFSKGGAPIKKIGKLFPLLQETAQFALSGSNISLTFNVQKNLWSCNFDKNQIEQVIDNIVINAKQAMPNGGRIEISSCNISIAENEHPPLPQGDYIKTSIRDCGGGIPKEILPHVFDPFFTTKATGNGLGLASCHSIIKRHGGCIDVESESGKGSTFHVFLPATTDKAPPAVIAANVKHQGSGTFLVMDDQDFTRETISAMLKSLGYSVVCKGDGKDAIDFIKTEIQENKTIAGIIFDLTVPGGIGGKDAINEIKKLTPKVPVFATSGYAEDPIMANPYDFGFTASICKPFRRSELSDMLNKYMQPGHPG